MNVSELEGVALDWAVAKCEPDSTLEIYFDNETGEPLCHDDWSDNQEFRPSTNWAQGGPIIEREMLDLRKVYSNGRPSTNPYDCWKAEIVFRDEKLVAGDFFAYGPTPLIAAMRCLIASKLGDEVEVPKELICTS